MRTFTVAALSASILLSMITSAANAENGAPDEITQKQFSTLLREYRADHPDDLTGADALVRKYTGQSMTFGTAQALLDT